MRVRAYLCLTVVAIGWGSPLAAFQHTLKWGPQISGQYSTTPPGHRNGGGLGCCYPRAKGPRVLKDGDCIGTGILVLECIEKIACQRALFSRC